MKNIISLILLMFLTTLITIDVHSQEMSSKYKEFKEMKLNFILDNTKMNKEEEEHFQCVFSSSEDKYHNSVWIKEKKIKKQIENSIDTINTTSASSYINQYYELEKLGINIRNYRNQKLLEKIRTKEVLLVLYQEELFDKEMFKRISNRKNKNKKKK